MINSKVQTDEQIFLSAHRDVWNVACDLYDRGGPVEPKLSTRQLLGTDLMHLSAIGVIVGVNSFVATGIWSLAPWAGALFFLTGIACASYCAVRVERRLPHIRERIARQGCARYELTARVAEQLQMPASRLTPVLVHALALEHISALALTHATPAMQPFLRSYLRKYNPARELVRSKPKDTKKQPR